MHTYKKCCYFATLAFFIVKAHFVQLSMWLYSILKEEIVSLRFLIFRLLPFVLFLSENMGPFICQIWHFRSKAGISIISALYYKVLNYRFRQW